MKNKQVQLMIGPMQGYTKVTLNSEVGEPTMLIFGYVVGTLGIVFLVLALLFCVIASVKCVVAAIKELTRA
jgi:hypothetical protein